MSVEAENVARSLDGPATAADRRASSERRRRERRKPGARVNMIAPRRSMMKGLGAFGVAVSTAALAFEAATLGLSILLLALGSISRSSIEIRLELMMLNGGMRKEDRRGADRRGDRRADAPPEA